jgi:hypothetical protein
MSWVLLYTMTKTDCHDTTEIFTIVVFKLLYYIHMYWLIKYVYTNWNIFESGIKHHKP